MKTPVIETERMILRPLYVEDAQRIFNAWATDPRVTKFMIYSPHEDVSTTIEWLKDAEKGLMSDTSYDFGFILKENGLLVGSGGAYYKPEFERYSIGYNFAYDYWHKGLCTEAMRAILTYFNKNFGYTRFMSEHAIDNPRSGEVMKKLGMHYEHDGEYTCFDGRVFKAKYYYLDY